MSSVVVTASYVSAVVLSLYLLWHFGVQQWYWHELSILAALALGMAALPEVLNRPEYTLAIGFFFTALFVWRIAAPVVAEIPHSHAIHPKHR